MTPAQGYDLIGIVAGIVLGWSLRMLLLEPDRRERELELRNRIRVLTDQLRSRADDDGFQSVRSEKEQE